MPDFAAPMEIKTLPSSARARPSARWGDLRLRIASAAVLGPLALACIWYGGLAFAGLVAVISAGMAFEWLKLCEKRVHPVAALAFAALPAAVVLTAFGSPGGALALLAVATIFLAVRSGGIAMDRPVAFGIPYLGIGTVSLVWLRQVPAAGRSDVIVLLLLVWASDIGAYLLGRAIGGPKLAPSISPGKTWSGALGGLGAAVAVGFIASATLSHGLSPLRAVCFAALVSCVSQAGDLFESQLKRHFGVKDSGWLVPGHGGLLDRLDALLFAAPVAGVLALILGRGVVIWQ
jgi:phosphatidate cytidylyltransferase